MAVALSPSVALAPHPLTHTSAYAHPNRLSSLSPAHLRAAPSGRKRLVGPAGAGRNPGGSRTEPELSVLRFTLGIPGLDEAYLPRYIGAALGSLLLLNHFVGSNGDVTGAQLRTEVVGVCLAAFSVVLPYLGRFLKGEMLTDRSILPEGNTQIFIMTEGVSNSLKEDFAWSSFVLLRNTNTMSVLFSVQGLLCVRGYWNVAEGTQKTDMLDWFEREIQETGLSSLDDTLYFPQINGKLWNILPNGAASVLVEPLPGVLDRPANSKTDGFLMLVSATNYAFGDKDRVWVKAIANKFLDSPPQLSLLTQV